MSKAIDNEQSLKTRLVEVLGCMETFRSQYYPRYTLVDYALEALLLARRLHYTCGIQGNTVIIYLPLSNDGDGKEPPVQVCWNNIIPEYTGDPPNPIKTQTHKNIRMFLMDNL